MRKMRAIAGAIAVSAMIAGSAQAGPSGMPYIAGAVGDLAIFCSLGNIGGACFDAPPTGATSVTVTVTDAVTMTAVGFRLGWYDNVTDLNRVGDFVPACSTGTFQVPEGANHLRVFIDGVLNGPTDCQAEGSLGVGVQGTIDTVWNQGV